MPSRIYSREGSVHVPRGVHAEEVLASILPQLTRERPDLAETGTRRYTPQKDDSPAVDLPLLRRPRLRISVQNLDTLSAARYLTSLRKGPTANAPKNVCILNQAWEECPAAGFRDGIPSQENFLCHRTTLSTFLFREQYPLDRSTVMFHPKVFVFADSDRAFTKLQHKDCCFVDVISATLDKCLRSHINMASAEFQERDDIVDSHGRCACGESYCDSHRRAVIQSMATVLEFADEQGVEQLVLNAWGCGTLGHDPLDIAKLWKVAVCGGTRVSKQWRSLKDIVFAVHEPEWARKFKRVFKDAEDQTQWGQKSWEKLLRPKSGEESKMDQEQTQAILAQIVDKEERLRNSSGDTRQQLRADLAKLNRDLAAVGSNQDLETESFKYDAGLLAFYARHGSVKDVASESPGNRASEAAGDPARFCSSSAVSEPPSLADTPSPDGGDRREEGDGDDEEGWFRGSVEELAVRLRVKGQVNAMLGIPLDSKPPPFASLSPDVPHSPY